MTCGFVCQRFMVTLPPTVKYCAVSDDIRNPPTEGLLVWIPYPSGNSDLVSYFPLKILAFVIPLPPLRISSDLT